MTQKCKLKEKGFYSTNTPQLRSNPCKTSPPLIFEFPNNEQSNPLNVSPLAYFAVGAIINVTRSIVNVARARLLGEQRFCTNRFGAK